MLHQLLTVGWVSRDTAVTVNQLDNDTLVLYSPGASLTKLQNGEHLQCQSSYREQLVLCAAIMMIVNSFTGGLNRHSVPGAIEGIGVSDRLIELAWRITGGCWSTTPATGAIGIIIIIIIGIIFFIIVFIAIVIIVAIGIIIIANHHNWPPPPATSAIAIRSLSDQTKMAKH